MVARIITGKSLKGALHYNEQKVREGKADLLYSHLFLQESHALTFRDKLRRFQRLLAKSPQVKTNAVHISLNFAPGEKLALARLEEIATGYMEKIGFGDQPYLVYRHLDAAHPHLHIVTTNIRPDGSRMDLHDIGRRRSEPARRELELAFGLVQAERQSKREIIHLPSLRLRPAQYGKVETKRAISSIVLAVSHTYNYTSLTELNAVLRCYGVTADRGQANTQMHRNKGLLYHLLDAQGRKAGVPVKASAIPGKPTLPLLEERFAQNKASRQPYREHLRRSIDRALNSPAAGLENFVRRLRKNQVEVLFRQSSEGQTYGVTFIDHRQGAVINGRELGKAYGAKTLLQRLSGAEPSQAKRIPPRSPSEATARHTHGEGCGSGPGMPGPEPLGVLFQAEQQAEQVPYPLRRQKRKKKKRNPPHL